MMMLLGAAMKASGSMQRSVSGLTAAYVPSMGYKLRKPSRKITTYEEERRAQVKLEKEYRANVVEDFWKRQTELENEFIENHNAQELHRKKRNEQNFRDSIIRIAKHTESHMAFLEKRAEIRLAKERKNLLEQQVRTMNKQRILKIMEHESANWINESNYNTIDPNSVLPSTIYDETDYYLKLHEQAFLFEQGRLEEMESVTLESKEIQYKNSLLMPIYQDVVSMVKHLKDTESARLEKEYQVAQRILIEDARNMQAEEAIPEKLSKLEAAFNVLRAAQKAKLDTPEKSVEFLHEHLLILYNMLRRWTEYTSLLKLPATVVRDILTERERKNEKREILKKASIHDVNDAALNQDGSESDMQSNDEKQTSESDEDLDIAKMIEEEKIRAEKVKEQQRIFEEKRLELERQQQEEAASRGEKDASVDPSVDETINPERAIESLMQQFDKQADEDMKNEFHIEKNSLYGQEANSKVLDARDHYAGLDLENVFARALIDNAFDFRRFSGLQFATVKDALKNEEKLELVRGEEQGSSPKKFETAMIVEVFKQKSVQLRAQKLSRAHLAKLNDIDTLLDLTGEVKVEEPEFLLKIWKNF